MPVLCACIPYHIWRWRHYLQGTRGEGSLDCHCSTVGIFHQWDSQKPVSIFVMGHMPQVHTDTGSILGTCWVHTGAILGTCWFTQDPYWVHTSSILRPHIVTALHSLGSIDPLCTRFPWPHLRLTLLAHWRTIPRDKLLCLLSTAAHYFHSNQVYTCTSCCPPFSLTLLALPHLPSPISSLSFLSPPTIVLTLYTLLPTLSTSSLIPSFPPSLPSQCLQPEHGEPVLKLFMNSKYASLRTLFTWIFVLYYFIVTHICACTVCCVILTCVGVSTDKATNPYACA